MGEEGRGGGRWVRRGGGRVVGEKLPIIVKEGSDH